MPKTLFIREHCIGMKALKEVTLALCISLASLSYSQKLSWKRYLWSSHLAQREVYRIHLAQREVYTTFPLGSKISERYIWPLHLAQTEIEPFAVARAKPKQQNSIHAQMVVKLSHHCCVAWIVYYTTALHFCVSWLTTRQWRVL